MLSADSSECATSACRACPTGASPDRLDALVYAVTELMGPPRPEPRITFL